MDQLLGASDLPNTLDDLKRTLRSRNEELCERVRGGDADQGQFGEAVFAHVRSTVRDKLLVTNPGWIGSEKDATD